MDQNRNNTSSQRPEAIVGTTVYIEKTTEDDIYIGSGSGFFIETDKIVTNVHILVDAPTITVKCVETETIYTIEGVIAFDDINDLAVLKIVEEATPFPLGECRKVRKGDEVYLIDCRQEITNHVEGTVDSIRNSGKYLWIEFNISDGQGLSGSPVLNSKGEVISVVQSGEAPIDGGESIRGKTISSNVLKLLLEDLKDVEALHVWQKRSRIHAYVKSYDGYLSRTHGDFKEAIALYDAALKLNPDLAVVYQRRSSAYWAIGKRYEACLDSLTALRLNPERFSILKFWLFLSWRWKVVRVSYRASFLRLLRKMAGGSWFEVHAQIRFRLAKMRLAKNEISEVFSIYQAVTDDLTNAINQSPIETKQKYLLIAQNLYQEAIGVLTEVIKAKPKVAISYCNRGRSKSIFGEFEHQHSNLDVAQKLYQGAIDDYTEAINLKLRGLYVYNHLGQTKHMMAKLETERGDTTTAHDLYQEIISDSDKALGLDEECIPCMAAIYHIRGTANVALDKHHEAIKDFDNSIHLNLNKALYYQDRGKAKEILGEQEAADADYAKAIELDPTFQ